MSANVAKHGEARSGAIYSILGASMRSASDPAEDKAQRWIIEACGYPKPGWHVVGFAGDHKGAVQIADAVAGEPDCSSTRIRDRKVLGE